MTAISGVVVVLVPGVGGVQHLFCLWYAGWQSDSIVPLVPSQFRQVCQDLILPPGQQGTPTASFW